MGAAQNPTTIHAGHEMANDVLGVKTCQNPAEQANHALPAQLHGKASYTLETGSNNGGALDPGKIIRRVRKLRQKSPLLTLKFLARAGYALNIVLLR